MDGLKDYLDMALEDVHKRWKIVYDTITSLYIVLVTNYFYLEIKAEPTLSIVLSYNSDAISLRSFIFSGPRFASRIPETFIHLLR